MISAIYKIIYSLQNFDLYYGTLLLKIPRLLRGSVRLQAQGMMELQKWGRGRGEEGRTEEREWVWPRLKEGLALHKWDGFVF